MLIFWLITFAASFGNILLGLFALARNRKSSTNVLFAILTFSSALWSFANFISLQIASPELALFLTRLVMFFVVGQTTSFFLLMFSFPGHKINIGKTKKNLYIALSVITLLTTLSPFLFIGLDSSQPLPPPVPLPGPGMAIFVLHALISVLGGLARLIKKFRTAEGIEKAQWKSILFATILLFTLVPITNFVAVVLFKSSNLIFLSPIYTLVFVALIYNAIARHKLLDVKLVVARTVAYVLLITALAGIYSIILFGLSELLLTDTDITSGQQVLRAGIAVVLAFTFQPLKRFFDRLTDRIFYYDRYDSDEVLNELGTVFISKINSFQLLDDSLEIIANTLKVQFGRLIVVNESGIYKTSHYGINQETDISLSVFKHIDSQITIYDELNISDINRDIMYEHGIKVILRLTTKGDSIGYLLLGSKQSGAIFTDQDISLLEILSHELAVAIQNARSYEEISQFGEMMKQEVLAATAKLRETNKRLVKLDEAKDEFISMASHQLRTPLTTVKGYLSMLLEGDAGKLTKRQTEFIDMSFVSSQRMVHLISDMLNVSRISTGRMTVDRAVFDLVKVVEDEVGQLRRQAEARGIKLTLHLPKEGTLNVNLDEGKIRQVIMNFIDNAIYYCPEGKIDVYAEAAGSDIEFRVKDNGIGVAESVQKQLFTKFFRSEKAKSVRPDGTGLGLYMAKQVIEIQGGEIIFESVEGEGSTFGFRFPLEDQKADK